MRKRLQLIKTRLLDSQLQGDSREGGKGGVKEGVVGSCYLGKELDDCARSRRYAIQDTLIIMEQRTRSTNGCDGKG